jgi:hypothetical protein
LGREVCTNRTVFIILGVAVNAAGATNALIASSAIDISSFRARMFLILPASTLGDETRAGHRQVRVGRFRQSL